MQPVPFFGFQQASFFLLSLFNSISTAISTQLLCLSVAYKKCFGSTVMICWSPELVGGHVIIQYHLERKACFQ